MNLKNFMDENFLLSNKTAIDLYHSYAKDMPIIDYHCHINTREIYEDKKFGRIKLQGKVIEKLKLYHQNKICVMEITKDMLSSVNEENGDTSDLISIGMSIDEVEVAVLFKESDEGTKVSLRSKFDYDVRKLAEIFGGGGHTKAAGLYLNKPMEEVKAIVLDAIVRGMI